MEEERDIEDKNFASLLNRFGSGMKGHQAMMRFEKGGKEMMNRSTDCFLDDLESLRRKAIPRNRQTGRTVALLQNSMMR